MSIVEHALDKTRARQKARQQASRVKLAATIDPALRLQPLPVVLDVESCRERRVLVGTEDNDGAVIAAYRMLRTRLLHRVRAKEWTTIAITSADQNDGKTLTALNLAMSIAREKSREIVLLDLDMRNPSICRTLGIRPAVELRHYLETGERGREMFMSVQGDNLLVAGSITPTEHASELLASSRFDELLRMVKQGAVDPVVLIDLPPVLLTDDALVVAPKIDAFLVVVSEGLTKRADLARALDLLAEFPVAGAVLNRAVESMPGYDYGYESDEGATGKAT